jgi:hypothetical protein
MEMVPIDRAELSEMVWKSRVKGTPERALARTYGLSVREVQEGKPTVVETEH